MKRVYKHRYKILVGPLAGQVFDSEEIGIQDYPGQYAEMSTPLITQHRQLNLNRGPGIWLTDIKTALYRDPSREREITIDKTVIYQGLYEDLVVPFDRNGNEIMTGDTIYVASKNEVRLVRVTKLSPTVYYASYGVKQRKLTVRDEQEGQTLTISDSRATIKAPNV